MVGEGLRTPTLGGYLPPQHGLLGIALGIDLGLRFGARLERAANSFEGSGLLSLGVIGLGLGAGLRSVRGGRIAASVHIQPQSAHTENQTERPSQHDVADQTGREQSAYQVHAQPPRRCLMRW